MTTDFRFAWQWDAIGCVTPASCLCIKREILILCKMRIYFSLTSDKEWEFVPNTNLKCPHLTDMDKEGGCLPQAQTDLSPRDGTLASNDLSQQDEAGSQQWEGAQMILIHPFDEGPLTSTKANINLLGQKLDLRWSWKERGPFESGWRLIALCKSKLEYKQTRLCLHCHGWSSLPVMEKTVQTDSRTHLWASVCPGHWALSINSIISHSVHSSSFRQSICHPQCDRIGKVC